ncbi:putative phage tail protein [Geobacter argillaceus]|uniref:Uncharacterized protein YmfQ (DUF2313 family) n=1 Tax=Geobacter argillaceus TaxID=345631 RepID=A0A562UZY6_9BACT|nr:putative phage tail protein [Geobacter argillaceus]TWJ11169.1 uncharacterized protein YmfQ (DUF2313 family) [Geobacter argillaceus]
MLHSDALKSLIPLALGATHDQDIALEGKRLDLAADRGAKLLAELFANSTYDLLEVWERIYAAAPAPNDSLLVRQNRIMQKMSELGRLDRAYFVQIATALAYTIILEELHPFMPGWSYAGEELGDNDSDWCWRVYYTEVNAYIFRAGEATAGDYLSYSNAAVLMQIFNDLKPADTFVEFIGA